MIHILDLAKKKRLNNIDKVNLNNLYWIDSIDPNNEEIKSLVNKFKLDLSDVKDCMDPYERPRLEYRKNYLFIIFRTPYKLKTTPIGIFLGKKFLITLHKESIKPVEEIINNNSLSIKDTTNALYKLLGRIIRNFGNLVDVTGDKLEDIEEMALKNKNNENLIKTVYSLRNSLVYIKKALANNKNIIALLEKDSKFFKYDDMHDIYIEINQLIDIEELYRDRLTGVLEIHLSSISNKLNVIMKSFAIIASLLLLPTLIAGIYGMNFVILPLSENPNGFWIVVLIMLISVFIMILSFKKKGWL